MENLIKCLGEQLGNEFVIAREDDTLTLEPTRSFISGVFLDQITSICKTFKRGYFVDAEIKKGLFIRIY
jgi:hypothetical protein